MAKVTSKYQVTVPRKIAEEYKIRPGDEIDWMPAGDIIHVAPHRETASDDQVTRLRWFDQATERQRKRRRATPVESVGERGWRREDLYDRDRSH